MYIPETGIASTQKAGQGDAVIFDRISKSNPIDLIIKGNDDEKKRQKDIAKLKMTNSFKAKQDLYKSIQDIKGKIWYRDVGDFSKAIDDGMAEIWEKQKNSNEDIFNTNDGMMAISSFIGKLESAASASKSAETLYNNDRKTYINNKDIYDVDASNAAYEQWANPKNITNEDGTPVSGLDAIVRRGTMGAPAPILKPFNPDLFIEKEYGTLLRNKLSIFKVLNDNGLTDQAKKEFDQFKTDIIPAISSSILSTGRITDPLEAVSATTQALDKYAPFFGYDASNDKDRKLREEIAKRKAELEEKKFAKKQSDQTTPTYAYEALSRVLKGKASTTLFGSNIPYSDDRFNLKTPDGNIYNPLITDIKSEKQADKSTLAVVGLSVPVLGIDGKSIEYKKDKIKVPAFDSNGVPVFQNSNLYQSIQNDAVAKGINYSGVSKEESKSGKKQTVPNTANNTPGFYAPTPTPTPKTTKPKKKPTLESFYED